MAVAARTIDDSLGRLSQRVAVKVKPEDVPLNLRGEGVTTHTMRLTWGPPIRYRRFAALGTKLASDWSDVRIMASVWSEVG